MLRTIGDYIYILVQITKIVPFCQQFSTIVKLKLHAMNRETKRNNIIENTWAPRDCRNYLSSALSVQTSAQTELRETKRLSVCHGTSNGWSWVSYLWKLVVGKRRRGRRHLVQGVIYIFSSGQTRCLRNDDNIVSMICTVIS